MDANTQDPQIKSEKPSPKYLTKILIIIVITVGFVSTFGSGFFLRGLLSGEGKKVETSKDNIPFEKTTPAPTSTSPQTTQTTTKFLPGKFYFDDTVYVITKDKPQLSLVATVTRQEQESNYAQSTRVSFFNGTDWTRQSDLKNTADSTIVSNGLVKSWQIEVDPSRVLKQTVNGEITINNSSLKFSTGVLQNEIVNRSLPGYTKLISNGTGTLTVNGVSHAAYVMYSRIYSLNAADIQFYTQPIGLTTDWLAFWDTQNNLYFIDVTNVEKPTPIYQTHQIAVVEDANGTVARSFVVSVGRDAKSPPTQYNINIGNPINATLALKRINGINKAPNGSYIWYMGNVEGTVSVNGQTLSGVGLIEYIKD